MSETDWAQSLPDHVSRVQAEWERREAEDPINETYAAITLF